MQALWFSRHQPTPEQVAEIKRMGYELVEVDTGIKVGGIEIVTDADVDSVVRDLVLTANWHQACAIFGVFPAPVLERFWEFKIGMRLFSAWNVRRSQNGGTASFAHKQWCRIA